MQTVITHITACTALIEDNFGLEPLAEGDRDAAPIKDIWK